MVVGRDIFCPSRGLSLGGPRPRLRFRGGRLPETAAVIVGRAAGTVVVVGASDMLLTSSPPGSSFFLKIGVAVTDPMMGSGENEREASKKQPLELCRVQMMAGDGRAEILKGVWR